MDKHLHDNPDAPSNSSSNDSLTAVDFRRRQFVAASLAGGLGALALPLPALSAVAGRASRPAIGFQPVSISTSDQVSVPAGYRTQLLYAWGDPVADAAAGRADAGDGADAQLHQAGMHHDGMHFFPFVEKGRLSSTHGLMCINHEYTDEGLLHSDGMANWSAAKVDKSKAAHGVSVIEVRHDKKSGWQVVRPSSWARRITADTPCRVAGPARGHGALRTASDPRGEVILGTFNNCAMGFTPWGTYLTCEENFNGYFRTAKTPTADQKRYGLNEAGAGYRWHEFDERFDAERHPNEPHRFGWVVEIDPWNPGAPPVKRTALGRFKHEGATVALAKDGRVVVYMGDDERFEYVYKFVSDRPYRAGDRTANADLLDSGTLYVARYNDDGSGQWLPLRHGERFVKGTLDAAHGFADQGEVVVRCRQAADLAGATKMDRPEWIAVHPRGGEAYVSLTNNSKRDTATADAANPRPDNVFGHILRWREHGQDAGALSFAWDIFVQGGDPAHPDATRHGTIKGDAFGSPDGLWFDADGRLWVQTDVSTSVLGKGDYARLGNNQMLVADVVSGVTRRFLTGPNGCEITGITTTPDRRSLFINIQHPGEPANERSDPARPTAISNWPANQFPTAVGGRPRSATIVITRDDGGIVGT